MRNQFQLVEVVKTICLISNTQKKNVIEIIINTETFKRKDRTMTVRLI